MLTSVGTSEDGERVVALAVSDEFEEGLLSRSFQSLGCRVVHDVYGIFLSREANPPINLVVADSLTLIEDLKREEWVTARPQMFLLAPNSFEQFERAWMAGADGVMLRSIDARSRFHYEVVTRR